MKRTFYIIIWLLGFLSSTSCTQRHQSYALLVQADSVMEEYPDSALHILESIEPQQLNMQADRAYYALFICRILWNVNLETDVCYLKCRYAVVLNVKKSMLCLLCI